VSVGREFENFERSKKSFGGVMGGGSSRETRTHLPQLSPSNRYLVEEEEQYVSQSPSSAAGYSSHGSLAAPPVYYSQPPPARNLGRRLSRKYSLITDQFTSVEQVCGLCVCTSWVWTSTHDVFLCVLLEMGALGMEAKKGVHG
jgi:hypothetical protein